ncbi:MAG TPA: TIM barrel protein [Propionibacteriaceae bacterium]|nr:TIM barrel protein [Propionibacteriaceae bacterium]
MGHVLPYAANCTFLFTEVDLLERPAAARAAGFDAIEFLWPWPDQPVPPDTEIDKFVTAVRDAGVHLIGLNFFAGDLAGADCGVLSIPARSTEFRDNIAVTIGIGEALGVPAFNALYGNRVSEVTPGQQDDLATENLTLAARAAAAIGGTVLVEPVSGRKPYPLRTASDVAAVLDRVPAPNIGFLCDLFHLANNGDDIDAALAAYAHRIAHVQIADHPGRGEPGTGTLDLKRYLSTIAASGYSGYVGLEYIPTTTTIDSLRWLRQQKVTRL